MSDRILRMSEVTRLTGLKRTTIWRRLNDPKSDFPRPVELGPRTIGWRESEILEWLGSRPHVNYGGKP